MKKIPNDTLNMVSSIEGLNNVKSMITSVNMSEISKYNAAHRISQEILNTIKKLDQKEFEFHLAQVMMLNQLIKNKNKYRIVVSGCLH